MQLVQLRDMVRGRAGISASDTRFSDSVITSFVNSSLRRLTLAHDWDWHLVAEDITLVVGQTDYAPGALWRSSTSVEHESGREYTHLSKRQARKFQDDSTETRFWYVNAGQLVVVPTPLRESTVTHNFYRSESALVADSDEPLWPDWAIDVVISNAALAVATRKEDRGLAELLLREYRETLRALRSDARRSTGANPPSHRRDTF